MKSGGSGENLSLSATTSEGAAAECLRVKCTFFPQVTRDRIRENGLRLHQGPFRFDTRKNFTTKKPVKHWKRVPREVMKSPSLEVL